MTSGFVLDASTTLKWAFDDESSSYAVDVLELLSDGFAVVPSLWGYEVANALAVGIRRSRITAEEASTFAADLGTLDIRVAGAVPDSGLLALEAAAAGLSAYDTSYLLLARDLGMPLATRDRALGRAARANGVDVLAPH